MDVATVLEDYLADITNLPADLAYILDEIKVKDTKLQEVERRIHQRDGALQKFLRAHGSLAENPKEQASYPRIRSDYDEALGLEQEKQRLSMLGLYLIAKQVKKLQEQCDRLENEGLLAPALSHSSEDDSWSVPPASTTSRRESSHVASTRSHTPKVATESPQATPAAAPVVQPQSSHHSNQPQRKDIKRQREKTPIADAELQSVSAALDAPARTSGPLLLESSGSAERPVKRARMDDEVYCSCRQPSHGNMVACDSDTCQYEWFHWGCVGLTEQPTGTWYCPQCRAERGLA